MKKISKKLLFFVLITITTSSYMGVAANNFLSSVTKVNYDFIINEKTLELPKDYLIMSKNNTTYVPLRFISEQLGLKVNYSKGKIEISNSNALISNDDSAKKIQVLETENQNLQKKIQDLEKELYRKLPLAGKGKKGLEVTVNNFSDNTNGTTMTLDVNNKDDSTYFVLDAYKTELYIDGVKYADVREVSPKLSATIKDKEYISGDIVFKDAQTKGKNGKVVFYYKINNQETDTLVMYFSA